MKYVSLGAALLLLPVAGAAGQTLNIVASPSTAVIFRLKPQDNSLVAIGTGTAQLKLEKNDPNTIVVRQDGFREMRRSFPKDDKYKDKVYTIFLTKRIVQFAALPYDANISVNGEVKGQRQLEIEVTEGQAVTVEVGKRGFSTMKRVYRWDKGGDYPPATERVELLDRRVSISSSPSGVELFSDDAKIGDGDAELVVKRGSCATLKATKGGWIPVERSYCNKDGLADPPVSDRVALAGRVVNVNAPLGARIFVNQKQAGLSAYAVRIAEGSCAKVRVEQAGFLPYEREMCVQDNAPQPPLEDNVVLQGDDSFSASTASDQANVNVTVEVGGVRTEEQAWKLLSSIVLSHFDVLENSDSQTGYLRTAWQLKSYGAGNEVVIRSRIIVKRVSDMPLRYSVKIVSERNKMAGISVKEDENFIPWDRLLNTYKDVISEMQARLK